MICINVQSEPVTLTAPCHVQTLHYNNVQLVRIMISIRQVVFHIRRVVLSVRIGIIVSSGASKIHGPVPLVLTTTRAWVSVRLIILSAMQDRTGILIIKDVLARLFIECVLRAATGINSANNAF